MSVECNVRFQSPLREWDGFGVNYVAAAQTRDYSKWPQDYGSFELLREEDRQKVIDMIFGDDGLRPCIGKMFIDSLQAGFSKPAGANPDPAVLNAEIYDHETTTKWMRYFWREGYKRIRDRGEELKLICTLYGPAAWMTKQKIVRGRDLDPEEKYEAAKYMISFVKFMREEEGLPVKYISLHNEGGIEEMRRWPEDGGDAPDRQRHDYNMVWPVEQVVDFIGFMGDMLKEFGLEDVGMANGECTVLDGTTKYVEGIVNDEKALKNFALMSSHGFRDVFTSEPIDVVRAKKPNFHGWINSASWGKMDITFLTTIHRHIYESKINGYNPWAIVQRHSQWTGGDPNPGTAFLVSDDGELSIERGYHLFKHYCPVGRAGMAVADTQSSSESIMVSAFASNGTANSDAVVVLNPTDEHTEVLLDMSGSNHDRFSCIVSDDLRNYESQPDLEITDGKVSLALARRGVATLIGR